MQLITAGWTQLDTVTITDSFTTCHITEFFHIVNLSCQSCGTDAIQDPTTSSRCVCKPHLYQTNYTASPIPVCSACPNGSYPSINQYYCIADDNQYDVASRRCNLGQVLLENYINDRISINNNIRQCLHCPIGSIPDPHNPKECVRCSCENVNCFCKINNYDTIYRSQLSGFDYFNSNFFPSLVLCIEDTNLTACQLVINLCVLARNRLNSLCANLGKLFTSKHNRHLVPVFSQYNAALLNYLNSYQLLLSQINVKVDSLSIVLISYYLNGSIASLRQGMGGLVLCEEKQSILTSGQLLGTNYKLSCLFRTGSISTEVPLFIEAYYSVKNSLYLVPFQVTSHSDTYFSRRIYLYRSLINEGLLEVAYSISLSINVTGSVISIPYISITYSNITSPHANSVVSYFSIEYKGSHFALYLSVPIIVVVLCIPAILLTGFKINGWMRRAGRAFCDPITFLMLLTILGNYVANILYTIILCTSIVYLLFYKLQTVLLVVIPTGYDEWLLISLIIIMSILKFAHIIRIIIMQCLADVFIIDWERPSRFSKSNIDNTIPPTAAAATTTTTTNNNNNDNNNNNNNNNNSNNNNNNNNDINIVPVSIWRTYFICKMWIDIQTERRVHLTFILLVMITFLVGVPLLNIASLQPISVVYPNSGTFLADSSRYLRFALINLLFLILASLNWLFKYFLWERFIENKLQQLIDVCSVGNISILSLLYKQFGYYIHGNSVHGTADTDLKTMTKFLEREHQNLVGSRGLYPNSNQQLFQVAIPSLFRKEYDRILGISHIEQPTQRSTTNRQSLSESIICGHQSMTKLMTSFIDNSHERYCHVKKDKVFFEKTLEFELFDPIDVCANFYEDKTLDIVYLLFLGHEWSILLLEAMFLSLCDTVLYNFISACLLTWLLDFVLTLIRHEWGKYNISRKTLIDKRFLI